MTTKPKIAIVVCAWPPMGGGIGNNAYYHAQGLVKLGYEVEVFTPRFKFSFSNHSEEAEDVASMGAAGFRLHYEPVIFEYGKAGIMLSLLNKLKGFAIVHLYLPFFGTDLIVWLFKKINPKIKLIIHYEMDPIGFGWQKYFFKLYMSFLVWLVQDSDKVIGLSWDHIRNSYLAKYLKRWEKKFTAIPNGVDTNIFYPQKRKESDTKTIIFVGGLDKQHFFKGVEILLQAFSLLVASPALLRRGSGGGLKLLIIGDGDLKKDYEKQAQDLGIADKVEFIGWIKNEKLPEYYAQSDVFVLPSTVSTESFGIVVAEAQACGVPVVVSNWPGVRKTLKAGETGLLVEPGSAEDLKEKLATILNDDKLQKMMGERGVERAKRLYNWDKVIGEIDKVYKKLLNNQETSNKKQTITNNQ